MQLGRTRVCITPFPMSLRVCSCIILRGFLARALPAANPGYTVTGSGSHQPSPEGYHEGHTKLFDIKDQLNSSRNVVVLTDRKI